MMITRERAQQLTVDHIMITIMNKIDDAYKAGKLSTVHHFTDDNKYLIDTVYKSLTDKYGFDVKFLESDKITISWEP